jgi:hypothetical protein
METIEELKASLRVGDIFYFTGNESVYQIKELLSNSFHYTQVYKIDDNFCDCCRYDKIIEYQKSYDVKMVNHSEKIRIWKNLTKPK